MFAPLVFETPIALSLTAISGPLKPLGRPSAEPQRHAAGARSENWYFRLCCHLLGLAERAHTSWNLIVSLRTKCSKQLPSKGEFWLEICPSEIRIRPICSLPCTPTGHATGEHEPKGWVDGFWIVQIGFIPYIHLSRSVLLWSLVKPRSFRNAFEDARLDDRESMRSCSIQVTHARWLLSAPRSAKMYVLSQQTAAFLDLTSVASLGLVTRVGHVMISWHFHWRRILDSPVDPGQRAPPILGAGPTL